VAVKRCAPFSVILAPLRRMAYGAWCGVRALLLFVKGTVRASREGFIAAW
jgi:hypothetical protein